MNTMDERKFGRWGMQGKRIKIGAPRKPRANALKFRLLEFDFKILSFNFLKPFWELCKLRKGSTLSGSKPWCTSG
jgi:hypothetical protein